MVEPIVGEMSRLAVKAAGVAEATAEAKATTGEIAGGGGSEGMLWLLPE